MVTEEQYGFEKKSVRWDVVGGIIIIGGRYLSKDRETSVFYSYGKQIWLYKIE